MVTVRAIHRENDYRAALIRIEALMNALSGPEGQVDDADDPRSIELDVLVDLVELYESKTVEIGFPTVIDAIEFNLDRLSLTRRDLVPLIGSRAKVSEVLSGKRPITMSMARALHQHLGIPADILLQDPGATLPDALPGLDWARFPLKAMVKAGWIPKVPDLADRAEEIITNLIERAGGREGALALYRKNDHRRINAKTDEYALKAWCLYVMAKAKGREPVVAYEPGAVTPEFLRKVANLSVSEYGPGRARDFLAQHGIGFEYLPHLPRTHLDGAAIKLDDGRPVIGMTLRYDRIDNFWYTLLHELSHVGLHLDGCGDENAFVDDHTLRGIESGGGDSKESDADQWAEEALIPRDVWEASSVRKNPSPNGVINLAQKLQVHPAVVAGRVRHERDNYRLLSQFVGAGEVRRQFEPLVDTAV